MRSPIIDLAQKCKAFHMRTLGVRRRAQPTPYVDEMCDLDQLLGESDFVVVTAPRTPRPPGCSTGTSSAR